jgi:hypothetical protein
MPTWKKVIVSGSNANLTALSVDNLTSGSVVIGGGTGNLFTTPINGTGSIVATTGASGVSMSGSFSGSFQGTFTGLINSASFAQTASFITASGVFGPYGSNSILTSSYAINSSASIGTLTFGEGLTTGTYNGSGNVTMTVSGAAQLTNNAITKWNDTDNKFVTSSLTDNGTVVSGGSSIQLTGSASSLTGSFTGSFIGDGSGLTGLVTSLRISGSNYSGQPFSSGSIALTTQGLIVQGTQNEIAVTASNQTITIGLPDDVTIGNNLTVTGDLYVNGTTTTINTTDLYVEDKFIVLASGSTASSDGGIIIDRGSDSDANIAFGFDADTDRWGYQNGLTDTTNAITIGALTAGNATNAFAGYVFTEATHGATRPTSGEFLQLGAIYTATDESIWMYS